MKQNIFSKLVTFVIGAGIGSFVTYKVMEKKHKEEIESVKEAFSNRKETTEEIEDDDIADDDEDENNIEELKSIINQNEYVKESNTKVTEEDEEEMYEPYVITPEEYGERDYAMVTLWYHTDGVVVNDHREVVENVEELVGKDFSNHFGENEDDPDTVYVRNDEDEIDYEILKEYGPYSEE